MFKVFKGGRRPAMIGGVPRTVAIIIFMVSATMFMHLHLWAFALLAFMWSVSWSMCRYDPQIFRILGLWLKTKVANLIKSGGQTRRFGRDIKTPYQHWNGSTHLRGRGRWEEDGWKR